MVSLQPPRKIMQTLDHFLNPDQKSVPLAVAPAQYDESRSMLAAEWHGKEVIKMVERPVPIVTDPQDAIIKITTTTVCGSDLHMYFNELPHPSAMQRGDVLGHEGVGVVESVGPGVTKLKIGDRVVISAVISCGNCEFCKQGKYSLCDTTNPSGAMEKLYGHRLAGILGYSHLTGAYDGTQAEFVRVPFADLNCLKLPDAVPDDQAILLSDVMATGWHANELGEVKAGQVVAVWGAGPVGLMAAALAKFRGAKRVIVIDNNEYRLEMASKRLGCETVNFDHEKVVPRLQELVPGGPDVCIDCAGYRFPKSLVHKFMRAVKLESDSPEVLEEAIIVCKKGGNISIIGDYFGYTMAFPIGAVMEKNVTMRGGQLFVQKYWPDLLQFVVSGQFDPSFIITHYAPLSKMPAAYHMFAYQQDNCIKVACRTPFYKEYEAIRPQIATSAASGLAAGSGTSGAVPFQSQQQTQQFQQQGYASEVKQGGTGDRDFQSQADKPLGFSAEQRADVR